MAASYMPRDHLGDGGHDAVFRVIAVARLGDIKVSGDAGGEENPR